MAGGGNSRKPGGGNIWLIIFSDITTNLMLFFLMLFAMSRMTDVDRQKVAEGIQSTVKSKAARQVAAQEEAAKKQKEERAIQDIKQEISGGKLSGQAQITVDEKTVKVVLNPEAFFASGSPKIAQSTLIALDSLVKPLGEFPNDIIIEGHTDNVPVHGGAYSSNWELSVARAVSVIDFFISKGLNERQFVAGGYGEYHPAYPNDTAENRARNRRIEVTILRQPGGMR
ncbi:MAG: flagellar motor protein MotB [Nitrospirae bacterium]|nr:flagellar motor protein MotB [Nitrospirota bacterium]